METSQVINIANKLAGFFMYWKNTQKKLIDGNICQNWLKYLPEDELFLKSCFYGINDSEKSLSLVSSQWHSWMLLPFQISNTPWTENYSKLCWMKMCSRENHYNMTFELSKSNNFTCSSGTPPPTFGHYCGNSLTYLKHHCFHNIWLEGFQEPHKKVVFIRPTELLVGF